jgi:hypothetical protein
VSELGRAFSKPIPASANAKGYRDLTFTFPSEDADAFSAVAVASAISGDRDQAFEYLEKAYSDGDDELLLVIRFPALDSLRSDPRYADLTRRLGLPE